MTEKIFVSCAQEDRGLIDKVEKALRKHGIIRDEPVKIIDPFKEAMCGDDIRVTIRKQIESASKVVIIHTKKSESSQWVNYEAGMADALNKQMIIVGRKGLGKTSFLSDLANVRSIEL